MYHVSAAVDPENGVQPRRANAYIARSTAAWIPQRGLFRVETMDRDARLKRLRFRSCHRGVREADLLVGGYFDRWHHAWADADMAWFEALLEEQDVDILAWAMGAAPVPARWQGEMMRRLQSLDYVKTPE